MLTNQMHTHLQELRAARALGSLTGLAAADMAALDGEIAATRTVYVGTAVTEIATLRAQLSGPQLG